MSFSIWSLSTVMPPFTQRSLFLEQETIGKEITKTITKIMIGIAASTTPAYLASLNQEDFSTLHRKLSKGPIEEEIIRNTAHLDTKDYNF